MTIRRVNPDEAEEHRNKQSSGFVTLDDQEFITCYIHEEVGIRETWFDPRKEKTEDFTEDHRKRGLEPTAKYVFFVYTEEKGDKSGSVSPVKRVQSFELNAVSSKRIFALRTEYGKVEHKDGKRIVTESGWAKKVFKIRRDGVKKQTNYHPYLMRDCSPSELETFKKAFGEYFAKQKDTAGSGEQAMAPEPELKPRLIEKLKAMDSPARMALFEKFGFKTVSELDDTKTQTILDHLEGDSDSGNPDDSWLK